MKKETVMKEENKNPETEKEERPEPGVKVKTGIKAGERDRPIGSPDRHSHR
jgi:hypothetical protein